MILQDRAFQAKRHTAGYLKHQIGETILSAGGSELGISVLGGTCRSERNKVVATHFKSKNEQHDRHILMQDDLDLQLTLTYMDPHVKDLKTCVKAKRPKRGEGPLPTKKEDLRRLYTTWNTGPNRRPTPLLLTKLLTRKMWSMIPLLRARIAAQRVLALQYLTRGEI